MLTTEDLMSLPTGIRLIIELQMYAIFEGEQTRGKTVGELHEIFEQLFTPKELQVVEDYFKRGIAPRYNPIIYGL